MEEKSLVTIEKNGFLQKIKLFFKSLFKKEKIENTNEIINESINENINENFDDNINTIEENSSFKDEFKNKQSIMDMQKEYESGNLLEENMSEEDKQKLLELYQEQIDTLNSNIIEYKNSLRNYKEKILAVKKTID